MCNKRPNWLLMAALVAALGMSVTSCKDDDKDENGNLTQEEAEAKAAKDCETFWGVVGQLVSSDDYTPDYLDKTFEPTYGNPENEGSFTRIMDTNDMQTAAQRFRNLISPAADGVAIDENTETYTWSDPAVGTMTYTRGGSANNWATVDVSIRQLPHLQRIIYREGGEGTNASFPGKAYYRFGDVVSKAVGLDIEYWICVRPAFGPEKKGDSHWVCLNSLPLRNRKEVTIDGKTSYLPTGLGTDTENMQNLAEMLWAIYEPEQWWNNANSYHTDGRLWGFSGLPIFTDFKKKNLDYHNQFFWQRVHQGWKNHEVVQNAFMTSDEDLGTTLQEVGLLLLYDNSSWKEKTGECIFTQANYINGTKDKEKNLHKEGLYDVTRSLKGGKHIDCRMMGGNTLNYNTVFTDGCLRWVIRHATGKQLNGGHKLSPTEPFKNNIQEVYRYYTEYPEDYQKADPNGKQGPEVTGSPNNNPDLWDKDAYTGDSYYHTGDVLVDENGHHWFVLQMSGLGGQPFTELVSFDGLTASADNGCITNAPTRTQALRFAPMLWQLFHKAAPVRDIDLNLGQEVSPAIISNIMDFANIDIRNLMQGVVRFGNARNDTYLFAVPYKDETTQKQKLLRCIEESNHVIKNDMHIWLWEHYPVNPSATEQFQNNFTTDYIFLQDVADQQLVSQYAEDAFARQPLISGDRSAVRLPRQDADMKAKDVTNYFYNRQVWDNIQYPTDMWNEPLICFRVDAVYDRGVYDHASITLNNHKLTMANAILFGNELENPNINKTNRKYSIIDFQALKLSMTTILLNSQMGLIHLDGKNFQLPSWREAWGF